LKNQVYSQEINQKRLLGGIIMLFQCCSRCEFHAVKQDDEESMSYCKKENCWSRYSKCVAITALNSFVRQESGGAQQRSLVLEYVYPAE
jgi:hypothetical protein